MLMAFLVLSWMWDRVVTDCRGGPKTVSYYYFQATMREIGTAPCPPGTGIHTGPCTVILSAPPVAFGPNIGDPGTGTTVFTYVDPVETPDMLPDPPLGGLAAWPWPTLDNPHPVVAVDRSGSSCKESCPGKATPPRDPPGREKPQAH